MTENMVVALTALNLEYEAVRRRLVDPQLQLHERGTRFEVGALRGTSCQIALALTGKGNQPAAVLAERAIHEFDPAAVLFVGVAGALWDATPLGDVVIATHVYAYQGGTSEEDGFKARPRVWEAEHSISQLASYVARLDDWAENEGPDRCGPSARLGAIAGGEIVHNSRISYEAELVRRHYNDALAIEMESAGVAQAGHLNGSPVAIVRGISDRADGTKTSDTDGTRQPQAADNAAAFATRLAQELVHEREHNPMSHRSKPHTGGVTNIAHGAVGIQANTVTGSSVSVATSSTSGASPRDLNAELRVIRDELDRVHTSGTLDSATYAAAQDELDLASKALESDTPENNGKVTLALKRLRGLLDEVADVAAKVTAVITAVNGLS